MGNSGFDCPVGCGGLWASREYRDEHIRRCHPARLKCDAPPAPPEKPRNLFDLMGI